MPTRLCTEPRCGNPAAYRGRCTTHAPPHEQATHPNRHIYNTKRWRILRRTILHTQPLCPCGHIATDVDHIQAIQDGGNPWNPTNLQPLCRQCHGMKTAQELRAR